MASTPPTAALVGSTGLVGSQILHTLLTHPSHPTIHALARRALPTTSPHLHPHIMPSTSAWPAALSALTPAPSIFLSALGTTASAAGSTSAQRAIDFDLNLALARAAKESGVRVYVLISSGGGSVGSAFGYLRMKAELEEAVKGVGFEYTVVLKPGLLMGERGERRVVEGALRGVARGLAWVGGPWAVDWWAVDAGVVGRAAVRAGWECLRGARAEGVWVVEQGEIVRLGKGE